MVEGGVEVVRVAERAVGQVVALQVAPGTVRAVTSAASRARVQTGRSAAEPRTTSRATASALRLALLVWIGPLSSTSTTRPALATRRRAVGPVEPHQRGDGIGGALGPAHADDQLASGVVEHAEERALSCPARRLGPQVRPALRPAVGEVGMGERLGPVPGQEVDVVGRRLPLQQLEAQPGAVDPTSAS